MWRISLRALLYLICGLAANMSMAKQGTTTATPSDPVRVYYLASNALHSIELPPASSRAIQVWAWKLPRSEAHEDYAGLSCNGSGNVFAHVSRNVGADPARARRTEIVLLDVRNRTVTPIGIREEVNLSWPVVSPDGSWIAATAFTAGKDTLAIVDRNAKTVRLTPYMQGVSPHSWSIQSDKVYVSAVSKSGQESRALEYSVKEGRFTPVAVGSRPVPSAAKGRLAVLNAERGEIQVVDSTGSAIAKIRKGFKDIVGWIDDGRLLAIGAVGGPDYLAVIDISSRKVLPYQLTTRGEVNGACIAARQRQ
jgi:hypothetical protein